MMGRGMMPNTMAMTTTVRIGGSSMSSMSSMSRSSWRAPATASTTATTAATAAFVVVRVPQHHALRMPLTTSLSSCTVLARGAMCSPFHTTSSSPQLHHNYRSSEQTNSHNNHHQQHQQQQQQRWHNRWYSYFSSRSSSSSRSTWSSTSSSSSHSNNSNGSHRNNAHFRSFFRRFVHSCRAFSSAAREHTQSAFQRAMAWYAHVLDTYPYTTQMCTSGFLGGAGDATTQWFEHQWDESDGRMPKPWDFRRMFAVAFFGVYFMGPIGHVWYERLDGFCHKYARKTWQMITVKVMGDTFLFGPICLWAFFVSVSLMEGISWKHTEQKIRRDFVPTYLVDYAMWPLVQGINFKYVPVQHQLLVVNLMCYFDDIFLSYVQHNSLPRIFELIEEWWERVLQRNGWDLDLHELTEMEEADDARRKELWRIAHVEREVKGEGH